MSSFPLIISAGSFPARDLLTALVAPAFFLAFVANGITKEILFKFHSYQDTIHDVVVP